MTIKSLLRLSALATVAGAISLAAAPAQAAPPDRDGHAAREDGARGGGWRGGGAQPQSAYRQPAPVERTPTPQAQPRPQSQPQPQSQSRPQRSWWQPSQQVQQQRNLPSQNAWQAQRESQRSQPQAQPDRRAPGNWSGTPQGARPTQPQDRNRGDWHSNDRNGSYADPRRNGGYADPNRNRDYRNDNRRNGDDHRYAYRNRDHNNWNNNWRRDRRYDWNSYRREHRDIYRVGRYRTPYYGYGYNRIGIGIFLDSLFYDQGYWISDPWYYRLPPAYGPYRWVRYYDDVLLVNIYTGQVVDVIYDFFW